MPVADIIRKLATLQDRPRCAVQKHAMRSRLDDKAEKDKATDKAWEACKLAVDERDRGKCRVCLRRVVKTLALDPKRAEHHHLCRRSKEKALRLDSRNIVLVHLACHQLIERHKLEPVQKDVLKFQLAGVSYVNADYLIEFKKATL